MQTNGRGGKSGPLVRWWGKLWSTPLPALGCEISHLGVGMARWSRRSSALAAAAWKPIASGAVEASPLRDNIPQPEEVQRAFGEALAALGIAPAHSSKNGTEAVLVIPDQAARLFVLNFDTFPGRVSEGLPLVKWRLKKSLPFDVESASISYCVQRGKTELQVVAVAAPQWIVRQYEAVAERFGLRPRWVILSTLASLGLAGDLESFSTEGQGSAISNRETLADQPETSGIPGVLVVKFSPPWFTTAILQAGMLRLFRTVGLSAGGDGLLSAEDVLSSVYPSIAYFQDNFHGPVARGYLCGLGENSASIATALERELNLDAAPLVMEKDGATSSMDPYAAERHFAALLGIVREQQNG